MTRQGLWLLLLTICSLAPLAEAQRVGGSRYLLHSDTSWLATHRWVDSAIAAGGGGGGTGTVEGTGTANTFATWSDATTIQAGPLSYVGPRLGFLTNVSAPYFTMTQLLGDTLMVGLDVNGNMIFSDKFRDRILLTPMYQGMRMGGRPWDTTGAGAGKLPMVGSDGAIVWVDSSLIGGGGAGAGTWGSITGTLSNQTDLQNALNAKVNLETGLPGAILVGDGIGTLTAVSQSGDVTIGTDGVTSIGNNKVTLGQMATLATGNVLGRYSAGTGNVEAVTYSNLKSALSLSNVENTALSTWAGTSNLTTLGTVATGTWNATAISVAKGGTGATTAAAARVSLLPSMTGNAGKVLGVNPGETDAQWISGAGTGTVTSVAMTVPPGGEITVTGSPITTSGTLGLTWANQSAGTFFRRAAGAGTGVPSFGAIAGADLPATFSQKHIFSSGFNVSAGQGTNWGSLLGGRSSSSNGNMWDYVPQFYILYTGYSAGSDTAIYVDSTQRATFPKAPLFTESPYSNDTAATKGDILQSITDSSLYVEEVTWRHVALLNGDSIIAGGPAIEVATDSGQIPWMWNDSTLTNLTVGWGLILGGTNGDSLYVDGTVITAGVADSAIVADSSYGIKGKTFAIHDKSGPSGANTAMSANTAEDTIKGIYVVIPGDTTTQRTYSNSLYPKYTDTASWLPTWADIIAMGYGTGGGDIEGVTAGDGVQGGGTSGTVTVSVNPKSGGNLEISSDSIRIIERNVRLSADTVLIYGASVGQTKDIDTALFRPTYKVFPALYNGSKDTLVVTEIRGVCAGSSPSITLKFVFDVNNFDATPTDVNTTALTVTSTTTGNTATLDGTVKIPPGVYMWPSVSAVGTQPTYAGLTVHGYKTKAR